MPIKKFGDWVQAGLVLRRLHVTLNNQAKEKLRRDADTLCEQIKTVIETGGVSPPDLESTLRKKAPETRAGIETYTLLDNIKVKIIETDARRGNTSAFIGVDDSEVEDRTGVSVRQVAHWLEFGNPTNNQLPRPVFYPTAVEAKKDFLPSWKRLVGETIMMTSRGQI